MFIINKQIYIYWKCMAQFFKIKGYIKKLCRPLLIIYEMITNILGLSSVFIRLFLRLFLDMNYFFF